MPTLDLLARFVGLDAGAGASFEKFGAQSKAAALNWKKFALGGVAAAAAVSAGAIELADKFEVSRSQLESAIGNIGGNFNALKGRIAGVDSQMQALGFTNTDTESGLAGLVVATKNTGTAIGLMGLAADIARGRNMSLADSTALLVKVETGHVALLARLGINTKNAAGATLTQQQALQRLTNLYGGDATRFAGTFSGQLDVLKAQATDLGKDLGLVLVPALTDTIHGLDEGARIVGDATRFFEQNKTVTLALAGALTGALTPALVKTAIAMGSEAWVSTVILATRAKEAIFGFTAAEDSAAVSTEGFMTTLGPIGVTLAAIGAIAAVTWERSRKASAAARASVDAYVSSLNIETNSMRSLATAQNQIIARQSALVTSAGPVLHQTTAQVDAFVRATATYKEYGAQSSKIAGEQRTLATNVGILGKQYGLTRQQVVAFADANNVSLQNLGQSLGAFKANAAAVKSSHQPLSTALSDFASLSAGTSTLSDDITSLDNAWNLLVGNLVSADQARTTVINDEKAWRKAIEASSGSISNQTKLGQAARAMLDQTTTDIHTQSDAIRNSGGTYAQAAAPIKAWIKQIESSGATGPFVKKLIAGLKKDLAGLKGAGQSSGAHLGDGIIIGINSKDQEVAHAASHLGSLAISEANRAMGIGSPSKKMVQAGKWLAEGLIKGWTGEAEKIKDALSTPLQSALDHLQTVMNNALTKQENALKAAKSKLKADLATQRSDISSLSSSISGGAGISGIFGTDANGNATTANVGQYLSAQVGPLEQFAKDLKWGRQHHLSQALLSQIAALGAVQGDAVLKQFMSGGVSIAQADQAEALINKYSRQAATTVVESPAEQKRLNKDSARMLEQTVLLREVRDEIRKLSHEAGKDVARNVTLKVEGGNLKLTNADGRALLRLLRRLEQTAGTKLI